MGQLVAMKHIKNPDQQNAWELHGDPLRDLSFYHYDALGSVAMTTGKNGQAIERYEYDVYGNAYDGWFSHNTHNDNPYVFTGQRYDRELGIYNFAYRDYNPHAMRWTTPDPAKDPTDLYILFEEVDIKVKFKDTEVTSNHKLYYKKDTPEARFQEAYTTDAYYRARQEEYQQNKEYAERDSWPKPVFIPPLIGGPWRGPGNAPSPTPAVEYYRPTPAYGY